MWVPGKDGAGVGAGVSMRVIVSVVPCVCGAYMWVHVCACMYVHA